MPERILIADGSPLFRLGLRVLISEHFNGLAVIEAGSTAEVLSAASGDHWAAIVLDLSLAHSDGLGLLDPIRHLRPETPLIAVGELPEEEYGVQVLKMGAAGYLTRSVPCDELVAALKTVLSGGHYLSSRLASILIADLAKTTVAPHEMLSKREREVFLGIAKGKSVTEVAEGLGRSSKTVATFRRRILRKLGLRNNTELTRYALHYRLIE